LRSVASLSSSRDMMSSAGACTRCSSACCTDSCSASSCRSREGYFNCQGHKACAALRHSSRMPDQVDAHHQPAPTATHNAPRARGEPVTATDAKLLYATLSHSVCIIMQPPPPPTVAHNAPGARGRPESAWPPLRRSAAPPPPGTTASRPPGEAPLATPAPDNDRKHKVNHSELTETANRKLQCQAPAGRRVSARSSGLLSGWRHAKQGPKGPSAFRYVH
jgi:hypothetical protein